MGPSISSRALCCHVAEAKGAKRCPAFRLLLLTSKSCPTTYLPLPSPSLPHPPPYVAITPSPLHRAPPGRAHAQPYQKSPRSSHLGTTMNSSIRTGSAVSAQSARKHPSTGRAPFQPTLKEVCPSLSLSPRPLIHPISQLFAPKLRGKLVT